MATATPTTDAASIATVPDLDSIVSQAIATGMAAGAKAMCSEVILILSTERIRGNIDYATALHIAELVMLVKV